MTTEPDADSQKAYRASAAISTPAKPHTKKEHDVPYRKSTAMQKAPQLSSAALTQLLIGMCLIPIFTIIGLWYIMPPVAEGQLECEFKAIKLPDPAYYEVDYRERDSFQGGELLVTNVGVQDWTHLNIQVNGSYQIYDREPIVAGATKSYDLSRFVSRAGARFQLQYNPLKSARIYARMPKGDRATYYCEFENGQPIPPSQ